MYDTYVDSNNVWSIMDMCPSVGLYWCFVFFFFLNNVFGAEMKLYIIISEGESLIQVIEVT